jgi:hypothetical protein
LSVVWIWPRSPHPKGRGMGLACDQLVAQGARECVALGGPVEGEPRHAICLLEPGECLAHAGFVIGFGAAFRGPRSGSGNGY